MNFWQTVDFNFVGICNTILWNDNIMQKNSYKCASHRLHLRKKFLSGPKKSMTILPKRINAFSFSPWQGQVLFCLHVLEKATILHL